VPRDDQSPWLQDGKQSTGKAGDDEAAAEHNRNGQDRDPPPDFDERAPPHGDEGQERHAQPNDVDPHAAGTLPTITIVAGERHIAANQGVTALHAAGVAFYRRDRGLVRVCLIKAKNTDGQIILVPGIMPITPAMLCRALGQSAHWQKFNSKGKLVKIDPPDKIVEQITGMVDEWPFPPLAGVITCPTLRSDGSLLAGEGYDLATGLVLFKTIPIPPIPEFPDARRCRSRHPLLDRPSRRIPVRQRCEQIGCAVAAHDSGIARRLSGYANAPDQRTGGRHREKLPGRYHLRDHNRRALRRHLRRAQPRRNREAADRCRLGRLSNHRPRQCAGTPTG